MPSRITQLMAAVLSAACLVLLLFVPTAEARTASAKPQDCTHLSGDPHCSVLTVHAGKAKGGYGWKVYGNGNPTASPRKLSSAWKAFATGKHAVCNKSCLANFTGKGKNNWKTSLPYCKETGYIWAKVNKKSKHVNVAGYGQSSKAVVNSLPKKAKQTKSATPYSAYLGELRSGLHGLNPSSYVTVICSAGLP